jgi:hypothetical protein
LWLSLTRRREKIREKRSAAIRRIDKALEDLVNECIDTEPGSQESCSESCQLLHVGFFTKLRSDLSREYINGTLTLDKMYETCSVWRDEERSPATEWHWGSNVPKHFDLKSCGYYRLHTPEFTKDSELEPWYAKTVEAMELDADEIMEGLGLSDFGDASDSGSDPDDESVTLSGAGEPPCSGCETDVAPDSQETDASGAHTLGLWV